MVKNKMSKEAFLRNNRGINDGGDLPAEFMSALYERIIHNEIKMKDEDPLGACGWVARGSGCSSAAVRRCASMSALTCAPGLAPGATVSGNGSN